MVFFFQDDSLRFSFSKVYLNWKQESAEIKERKQENRDSKQATSVRGVVTSCSKCIVNFSVK